MATAGATFPIDIGSADGQHFLVVEMRYYSGIADQMLAGAAEAFEAADATFDLITVPGLLEIPAAIAMALEAGDYDGFVALGTFTHTDGADDTYLIAETTKALLELSVVDALPLGNGLVAFPSDFKARAAELADINAVHGATAARSAIAMAALKAKLNS